MLGASLFLVLAVAAVLSTSKRTSPAEISNSEFLKPKVVRYSFSSYSIIKNDARQFLPNERSEKCKHNFVEVNSMRH